ncbi:MAG: hypothetical protein II777_00180 [Clostridia bacterium]|nr:hypothetical protein [Clostridia bacterium]
MINRQDCGELKEKYRDVTSRTIWKQPTDRPRSDAESLKRSTIRIC